MTLGLFKDITNWTLFETDEQKRFRKNKEYQEFLAKAPLARPEVVQQAEDYIKRERGKQMASVSRFGLGTAPLEEDLKHQNLSYKNPYTEQMPGTSLLDILAGATPNLVSTVTAMPYGREQADFLKKLATTQRIANPTANNVVGDIYNLSRTGGGGFKTPEVAKEVVGTGAGTGTGGGNLMSMLPYMMMMGGLGNTPPTITPSIATPGISIPRTGDAYAEYWRRNRGLA